MKLAGHHEGQVVARVVEHGHNVDHEVVQPEDAQMGPHHQRANEDATQVAKDVLHGVCIRAGDADRGSPLVVGLVDMLVQAVVMQQPGGRGGEGHEHHGRQWE